VVSRASLTLEGSLPCKHTDPGHPTPMEVAEGPSALEVAAVEDPAPTVALVVIQPPRVSLVVIQPPRMALVVIQPPRVLKHALSLYCFRGRPHWITPSPVRGGDGDTHFYGFHWSSRSRGQRARCQEPAASSEVTPSHALDIVPVDLPSSSHAPSLPALGLPLLLSNLQVSQPFAPYCSN
jgi:hypothetical protein